MYYLWRYPDGGNQWIGVGWYQAAWNTQYHVNDLSAVIRTFDPSESGWYYGQTQDYGAQNLYGRYEAGDPSSRLVLSGGYEPSRGWGLLQVHPSRERNAKDRRIPR